MFIPHFLSTVTILAANCFARPTNSDVTSKVVIEKLEAAPVGWVKDSSAQLDKDATSITLKIHLVNADMDKFHSLAMDVRLLTNSSMIDLRLTWGTDCNSWSCTVW